MIYGVGIDIVSVQRLREVAERWGWRFLQRVFSSTEIDYCLGKKDPYPPLSARFATKEAMVKALGGKPNINLREIEVSHAEAGRPIITPGVKLRECLEKIGIQKIHLSLSHEKDYSMAIVILEL